MVFSLDTLAPDCRAFLARSMTTARNGLMVMHPRFGASLGGMMDVFDQLPAVVPAPNMHVDAGGCFDDPPGGALARVPVWSGHPDALAEGSILLFGRLEHSHPERMLLCARRHRVVLYTALSTRPSVLQRVTDVFGAAAEEARALIRSVIGFVGFSFGERDWPSAVVGAYTKTDGLAAYGPFEELRVLFETDFIERIRRHSFTGPRSAEACWRLLRPAGYVA